MQNKSQKFILGLIIFGALLSSLVLTIFNNKPQSVSASVAQGSDYHATTTSTGRFTAQTVIQTYPGTLGSVVITGAAAGTINLYDATTSDVTKRTGNLATSSILVASMPVSAAAATYTFDEALYNGLFVDIIGTMPTSTITYR